MAAGAAMRSALLGDSWARHGYYSLDIHAYSLMNYLKPFMSQETHRCNCEDAGLRPTGSYI